MGVYRLRVVPLSLSPSCVTRKKTARKKWPREILWTRRTAARDPGCIRPILYVCSCLMPKDIKPTFVFCHKLPVKVTIYGLYRLFP